MKHKVLCIPIVMCCAFLSNAIVCSTVIADSLTIPTIDNQPVNSPEGVHRPVRAMTMDQVRSDFGEPKEIIPAVGNPPITRWIYDRFVVHFEHQYVIHSVAKK